MTYDLAKLQLELVRDEGERFKAYRDTVGKWSIGVGRNLDDVGISADETRNLGITVQSCLKNGITQAQSRALLANDIARTARDLDRNLPWWRNLDPVRQRALLNMAFNMGAASPGHGLLSFSNSLAMLKAGRYADAAANFDQSKWARQVGARAQRLEAMIRDGRG